MEVIKYAFLLYNGLSERGIVPGITGIPCSIAVSYNFN